MTENDRFLSVEQMEINVFLCSLYWLLGAWPDIDANIKGGFSSYYK